MKGLALDASVIIPALLAWHEHHEAALPVVQRALAEPGGALVPLPALLEAYAVMTRLPPPGRLRPQDAATLLRGTFAGRARLAALSDEAGWELLDSLSEAGIAGGATFDAHVLACARSAGAQALATFNRRDFERFGLRGIALIRP